MLKGFVAPGPAVPAGGLTLTLTSVGLAGSQATAKGHFSGRNTPSVSLSELREGVSLGLEI
jgi:hypothetical protein